LIRRGFRSKKEEAVGEGADRDMRGACAPRGMKEPRMDSSSFAKGTADNDGRGLGRRRLLARWLTDRCSRPGAF